jgi:hypothetical protein
VLTKLLTARAEREVRAALDEALAIRATSGRSAAERGIVRLPR